MLGWQAFVRELGQSCAAENHQPRDDNNAFFLSVCALCAAVARRRPFPFVGQCHHRLRSSFVVVVLARPTAFHPGWGGGVVYGKQRRRSGAPNTRRAAVVPRERRECFLSFIYQKKKHTKSSSSSSVRGGGGWQKPRYLRLRVARVPVACGVAGRTLFDNTSDRSDAPARHVLCTILNNGQNGVRV